MVLEILQKAAQPDWVEVPGKGYDVSADRMYWGGQTLKLCHAAEMDIAAFNRIAGEYNVHIEESDPPIDRLVKVAVFLYKRDQDGSSMPFKEKYSDMLIDVAAAAKAKPDQQIVNFFNDKLTRGCMDALPEVFEFYERIRGGGNDGKYRARLLRFDENAKLVLVDDNFILPEQGYIRTLGKRRYPLETIPLEFGKEPCLIEDLEKLGFSGSLARGFWDIGKYPIDKQRGKDPIDKQRIVVCGPYLGEGGIFHTTVAFKRRSAEPRVGALRLRESVEG